MFTLLHVQQAVMGIPGVDGRRTQTNHVMETAVVLGIEAARAKIIQQVLGDRHGKACRSCDEEYRVGGQSDVNCAPSSDFLTTVGLVACRSPFTATSVPAVPCRSTRRCPATAWPSTRAT